MITDLTSLTTLFAGITGSSAATNSAGDPAAAISLLRQVTAKGAEAKGVAAQAKDPVTLIAVKQFQQAIAKAKDVKSALADPRVLKVLLPALGLSDQLNYPGLAQRALVADPNDKAGLLANLDARWKTAAQTLNLKSGGLAALKDPALQASIVSKFTGYEYHQGLDEKQPGVSDALYFIDNAATDAGKVYDVLGDQILRRVVTGALGLPQEIAIQPIETQAKAVTSRLNLNLLKDPKQVQKLAERYLLNTASNAASTGAAPTGLLSLFA